MLHKQERAMDLYERKGYLSYLIEEVANLEDKSKEAKEPLLFEIDTVINDIIYIAIELHKDYPDIQLDLGIINRNI